MKQAIDTRTAELSGLDFSETGNAAPAPKRARGPYRGAVRLGSSNQADRARAGLTQEACAALAGVSVRALRMWEHSRNPSRE